MTTALIDASAAIKLVLIEDGSAEARRLWLSASMRFVAPAVLLPEVSAALDVARRDGRVAEVGLDGHLHALAEGVTQRAVDAEFGRFAASLLPAIGPCRGMDLLYIAAALELGGLPLLSFDPRQRDAATRVGLGLLPARIGSPGPHDTAV